MQKEELELRKQQFEVESKKQNNFIIIYRAIVVAFQMLLFNENYRRSRPARKCIFLRFLFLAGTTGPVHVLLFQSRPRPSFPSLYHKVPIISPDENIKT